MAQNLADALLGCPYQLACSSQTCFVHPLDLLSRACRRNFRESLHGNQRSDFVNDLLFRQAREFLRWCHDRGVDPESSSRAKTKAMITDDLAPVEKYSDAARAAPHRQANGKGFDLVLNFDHHRQR